MMGPAKDINNGTFFSKCCALLTRGQLRTPYLDQMGSIWYYNTSEKEFWKFWFFRPLPLNFQKKRESSSQKNCQNDLEEPVFFNLKCRARSKQELPRCPRNVISDDYRFIPLRRRKFEVIRVLDHDFRGHQSREDQYFENVGSHLLRILLIC